MCLFCKLIAREIPADMVFEDEHVLAFRDIRPVAPTHVLVIPKKHVVSLDDASPDDEAWAGRLLVVAAKIARDLGLDATGWRLVMNNGADAGQSVFHVHAHVLGGRQLGWPPG